MENRHIEDESNSYIRTEFKTWRDREVQKILGCTWASQEGIKAMWMHIRQQEEIFEKNMAIHSQQAKSKTVN